MSERASPHGAGSGGRIAAVGFSGFPPLRSYFV
jgi:hypothetical protein